MISRLILQVVQVYVIFVITILSSCSKENKSTMIVKGDIQGLKKGMLYLQKVQDSALVNVDSMEIAGNAHFTLETELSEPELFYLYLNKKDGNSENDRILFFGEAGSIEIRTTLKRFELDAKISGSKIQDFYEEYLKVMRRFNDENLSLIEANFNAQKEKNQIKVDSIQKVSENLLRRRYLYAINFALNHKDSNLAPYIAIAEIYDANPKMLDTIYKSLDSVVKNSKYGQYLKEYLAKSDSLP